MLKEPDRSLHVVFLPFSLPLPELGFPPSFSSITLLLVFGVVFSTAFSLPLRVSFLATARTKHLGRFLAARKRPRFTPVSDSAFYGTSVTPFDKAGSANPFSAARGGTGSAMDVQIG